MYFNTVIKNKNAWYWPFDGQERKTVQKFQKGLFGHTAWCPRSSRLNLANSWHIVSANKIKTLKNWNIFEGLQIVRRFSLLARHFWRLSPQKAKNNCRRQCNRDSNQKHLECNSITSCLDMRSQPFPAVTFVFKFCTFYI